MEKTQVTDLFRFVTLRGPQLISKDRRSLGFVEHPNPDHSHFLQLIEGIDNVQDARSILGDATSSFDPYISIEELKIATGDFWKFSHWLGQNKDDIKRATIDDDVPSDNLDTEIIEKLWDTVFFQLLEKTNNPVRQACLQLLVAANFMSKYLEFSPTIPTDDDELLAQEALLKRLANGKVVINKAFTVEKKKVSLTGMRREDVSYSKQEKFHSAKIAGLNCGQIQTLIEEFCKLQKTYNMAYHENFNVAYSDYQSGMAVDVENFLRDNPEMENNPDAEDLIPYAVGKKFDFQFPTELSPDFYQEQLSEKAVSYLGNGCTQSLTIKDVLGQLELDKQNCKKAQSQTKQRRVRELLVNGVKLKGDLTSPRHFSLSFNESLTAPGSINAYFSLGVGYNGAHLTEADFELTINGQTYTNTQPVLISNNDQSMFMELFPTSTLVIPENVSFVFKADFTLDNGKSLRIRKSGHTSSSLTSGVAYFFGGDEANDILYGINKIGVADFRKVEQELCCYVPGEVSHIENIMAKEYKEKSTRNYVSSEVSTETSQEREMEQLSDQTSTERNEMSSEIANVIEKDKSKNYGASATASGKIPGGGAWGVNGSMDIVMSQSTSKSNSEAKTFAEDLTRRALERIVQKTSVKRTSKMIRQFEDNTKHGFDNREGTEHVTGVFRWVNKVYKNRIVNYGKRLMYEFMIPEPSRFYKEAVIIEAEQEDIPNKGNGAPGDANIAVKPVHPRDNEITSAKDITRANYQSMCAIYDASPMDPEEQFATVSATYSESHGNGDSPQSYNYGQGELSVPEGYECIEISGPTTYNYKAKNGANAYLKINTASKNWQVTGLSGQSNGAGNINHALANLTGSISTSINTKKITSFSVALKIKCQLKASLFNTWQQEVYDAIMDAYNGQLQEFNDAQTSDDRSSELGDEAKKSNEIERNPLFNSDIVMTELKRLCIEMLTSPFGITQGMDFYENGQCDVPKLKLSETLDDYSAVVKFFEQAFDWEIMAQKFYPYYWAKRCDWKALFQSQDSVDYNFQAFLQSGMGRVVVPVRPGFEDAVTFFMETGEIWNGIGMAIDTDDELYLSIMDEVTQIEGRIEGQEWNTIVPSSLTIVQANSVKLDQDGLPCCEDASTLDLIPDTNTLSLQTPTS